jgi:hypothetical protein
MIAMQECFEMPVFALLIGAGTGLTAKFLSSAMYG